MTEPTAKLIPPAKDTLAFGCRHLSTAQVVMIDEALGALGGFGQVRLVVQKDLLRYIVIEKSYDVLKWERGSIE